MSLLIVNSLGYVHRADASCTPLRMATRRKPITDLQALVYKLPPCPTCWPNPQVYNHAVGIRNRAAS